ncbi:MHFG family PEP-CTERM protein [Inhella proteolytica]|uniref:MHFG family PEP-CTERM protein n=1 Tax=Inhella proteolytica TaxID=2795029 RepID=A0A931NJ81_9BURK|nr:MHFG family PEP-CTERM protein [Inhella proteolytica]MBH9578375.1 MHFG family PEP-CTERM protein [Inhella proteolytica]
MSLLAALALAASTSTATLPHCSWNRPGANPFTGDLIAAVDRYQDIPQATRAKLKARMAKREYDEIALITRGAILGKSTYNADISDMHFGSGQVCKTVSRQRWSDTHQERGLVYCQDGHCLIVPTVCRNLSRIVRNQLEPIAGAAEEEPMVLAAALDGDAPLEFEAPGAGGDQPLAGASFDSLAGAPEGSELGPHSRPTGFVPASPSFNQLSDPSSPALPGMPTLPTIWPQPDMPGRLPSQAQPTPEPLPPGTPTPGPVPPEVPQPPTLLPNPPVPPKPEPLPPLQPDTPDSPDSPPGGGGGTPPGGGGGTPPGGGGGTPPGGGGGTPPGGGGGTPPGGGGGTPPGGGGGTPPGGGGATPPGGGGATPPGGGGGTPPGGGGGTPPGGGGNPPPPPPPPFGPDPDPLPPPPPFDPKDPPKPEGDPFPPPLGGTPGGGGGKVPEPGGLMLGLLGLLGLAAARRR